MRAMFMPRYAGFALALMLLLAGCAEKKRPRPPNERNRMVLSFFDAMKNGRSEEAAMQADRLQALLPDSNFLRIAADTQRANAVVAKMNELLKEGKLKEASKLLDNAIMENPFNEQLKNCAADLAKLEALDRAVNDMDPELPSEEQKIRLTRLKNALAPFPRSAKWDAAVGAAERNLACRIRLENRDWRFFCDGVLMELSAEKTPDAELRSTVRTLRGMGSQL